MIPTLSPYNLGLKENSLHIVFEISKANSLDPFLDLVILLVLFQPIEMLMHVTYFEFE